jgi:hypothetical protein
MIEMNEIAEQDLEGKNKHDMTLLSEDGRIRKHT